MPRSKAGSDPSGGDPRRRIAFEAAKLLALGGAADFQQAKRKAAERLGVRDDAALPGNAEVERELREYQRLFQADVQPQALRARREAAVDAMRFLARFQPRLVGPVLEGTADATSPVVLQVFTDLPDEVGFFLTEHGIPARLETRRLRPDRERDEDVPAWTFRADGLPFEVTVLPSSMLRQAPLSPVDARPMQRATLAALQALLDAPG
jgi:hypothetical protein